MYKAVLGQIIGRIIVVFVHAMPCPLLVDHCSGCDFGNSLVEALVVGGSTGTDVNSCLSTPGTKNQTLLWSEFHALQKSALGVMCNVLCRYIFLLLSLVEQLTEYGYFTC